MSECSAIDFVFNGGSRINFEMPVMCHPGCRMGYLWFKPPYYINTDFQITPFNSPVLYQLIELNTDYYCISEKGEYFIS